MESKLKIELTPRCNHFPLLSHHLLKYTR
ncbi:hypothetical protein CCACVL1_00842 [Corchorus capsularis]|uniref:Uncharacterized protein n=1 Tax=Corchorus capsularis TaxID=210143 RepID=A0A1R3KU85_COCAP|nr:hypothetical protein CCACVL1_00842 [Corchorus capsularis]